MERGTQLNAAFLTGSRKYGTPREDSDYDLVIFVDKHDKDTWDALLSHSKYKGSASTDSISVRFGELNFICLSNQEEYDAWYNATLKLSASKPVARDVAVAEVKAFLAAGKGK